MKDFWTKVLVGLVTAGIIGAVRFSYHVNSEMSAIKTDVAVIKTELAITRVAQSATQK